MAFLRRKRVHGHEYYQAVRNVRDSNGIHRQEVLCHLGKHRSLDTAISAERTAAKIEVEKAFLRSRGVSALDTIIRNSYPDRAKWLLIYCEEDIEDIPRWLNEYRKQRSEYERYLAEVGHKEFELAVEELDMEIEFLEMCLKFCAAMDHEVEAMQRARKHEEKLQKFLQVKHEYF